MNIDHRVREIIAEQLGISEDEIATKSSFQRDLGADSLDVLELIMGIEEEFELEIPDPDIDRLTTVKDLIDYVSERCAAS